MVAIEHEKHEVVKYLLSIRADLKCKESSHGNTALHIAALKGDHISCKLVFTSSPETCLIQNYKGETPIHLAVRS
jgi:ankyrin repeat protein